jgi:type I restriction enzyme M protein
MRANYITNLREIKQNIPLLSSLKRSSSLDWAFIAYLVKSLKKDGVGIALTTVGTTFNLIDKTFREYFVKNGFLEAVISLPEKLLSNTSVKTILYVFSNNNKTVKMIDATDVYVNERRQNVLSNENIEEIYFAYLNDGKFSKTVNISEIEANDYILLPNRYLTNIAYKNGVKLGSILTVNRGAPLKASELDGISTIKETGYKYLMLSDISDGLIDEELHNITQIDSSLENYLIKENNLIISKIGSPFKVAILNKRDSKILANGNLYILSVDESKANPYYIQAFLQSNEGQKVLESKAKGVQFSSISKGDLLELEIPLPSILEQNEIGESLKNSLNQIVDLSKKLEKEKVKIASLFNMKLKGNK